jgi:hypothetical protein
VIRNANRRHQRPRTNRPLRSEDTKGRGRSWSPQESRSRRSSPSRRRWTNRRWQPMTSFMSVGWGPSRQVTRQAGGLQARTSEDVQGVGWAAAEAGPAESPGGPHEAGGNADPRWMAATPGPPGTQKPAYRPTPPPAHLPARICQGTATSHRRCPASEEVQNASRRSRTAASSAGVMPPTAPSWWTRGRIHSHHPSGPNLTAPLYVNSGARVGGDGQPPGAGRPRWRACA